MKKYLIFAALLTALITTACGPLAPIADPDDEDGSAPTFNLNVNGPGLNVNISSDQACPPDGLTNPFGRLQLRLPSDREYAFIYTVSDIGGVPQSRVSSNDTNLLNFIVEAPDGDRLGYTWSDEFPVKTAIIGRGEDLRTALLASGKFYPTGSGSTSIALDGFDAAGNNTFKSLTIIIGPGLDPELLESTCP